MVNKISANVKFQNLLYVTLYELNITISYRLILCDIQFLLGMCGRDPINFFNKTIHNWRTKTI